MITPFKSPLLPRTYATWIALQIATRFVMLALLIESIFLLQHFFDIFEAVIDETDSFSNVVGLVLLTMPDVYFALPVAVVAAVFLVLRECQERRELLVLASMGLGIRQLWLLAAVVGLCAQFVSLIISGYILPYSSFAFRSNLIAIREQALDSRGAAGHFYSLAGQTIMRWPATSDNRNSALFATQSLDNAMQRVITARGARLTKMTDLKTVGIVLSGVAAFDFPKRLAAGSASASSNQPCRSCAATPPNSFQNSMTVANYERMIDLSELFRLEPRGLTPREWTLGELLGISTAPIASVSGGKQGDELITRLARGFSCLVAPFAALLALTFGGRLAATVALPAACVTILCVDVGGLSIGRLLVDVSIPIACLALLLVYASLIGALAWQTVRRQLTIASPAVGKA
jgi:lipopolysaccharide export system permease protein